MSTTVTPSFPQNAAADAGFNPGEDSVVSGSLRRFGRSIYVLSYHFMPRTIKRSYQTYRNGGMWTTYNFAPVLSRYDRPSVCIVKDGLQDRFMGTVGVPGNLRKEYSREPWPAIDIARDIVNDASGAPLAGPTHYDHPAIWISACGTQQEVEMGLAKGLIPPLKTNGRGETIYSTEWDGFSTDPASPFAKRYPEFAAECRAFAERQWRHCEMLVRRGDAYHSGPQASPLNITEIHRNAASWIKANSAEHPWIANTTYGAMVPCPFCGKSTSTQHPICGTCNRVINPVMLKEREEALANAQKSAGAGGKAA